MKKDTNSRNKLQNSLFPDDSSSETEVEQIKGPKEYKKLKLDSNSRAPLHKPNNEEDEVIDGIPQLVLPTRWERLQPKIQRNEVSIRTIIRPVSQAMNIIRDIIEYLKTTDGCQVLIMRADTGSGKTTFLNTLPHYMQDVPFHTQTIELQNLSEDDFGKVLWQTETQTDGINLIILEGREKPESVTDKYIQVVLAHINRFSRERGVPLLFVIPTIEEQVARNWCDHGAKVGDLIPEQKLYQGSRWYNFPGVPKTEYVEIVEETVQALNPPYVLTDFGVSSDELKNWARTAHTIGGFIEIVASETSSRRRSARIHVKGPREHVWIVYCSPDLRHFDHTLLVINGLVQDERLKASPTKLIPPSMETTVAMRWRQSTEWKKLVATINFLDVRLINLPIITVVTAALAYGDDELIQSFKKARLIDFKDQIPEEMAVHVSDWDQPLSERRLQTMNARGSMERSNLFRLLRGMPAEPQKGGNPESAKVLAQYKHLMQVAPPRHLHYYLGLLLRDLLQYHRFPGYSGIETEEPLIPGEPSPVPDIAIHTERDIYALEFHFLNKQIAPSEVTDYALERVVKKYMGGLGHLRSQLDSMT